MATVAENAAKWEYYRWDLEGHEWSPGGTRAGTELLWWRSIRPRIGSFLPAQRILEIAPGFGRWTAYLLDDCSEFVGVDVTPRCIDVCRARFASVPYARFWVNDGSSLDNIADSSIDLVFSFDSLVHVELEQIRRYAHELARVLRPGGVGFFHHSNLGAYVNSSTGAIPAYVSNAGWRAPSMSARAFREVCRQAGLRCVTQEVINWVTRGAKPAPGDCIPLSDCFSSFTRPAASSPLRPTKVYVNNRFALEWQQLIVLSSVYSTVTPPPVWPQAVHEELPNTIGRKLATAKRIVRTAGLRGVASTLRHRLADSIDGYKSLIRSRVTGGILARVDPIRRALKSGRCPDCSAKLVGQTCRNCSTLFFV